jgi:hypothetical protein
VTLIVGRPGAVQPDPVPSAEDAGPTGSGPTERRVDDLDERATV